MPRLSVIALTVALVLTGTACRHTDDTAATDQRRCDANDRLSDAWRNYNDTDSQNGDTAAAREELLDALAETGNANSDTARSGTAQGNPTEEFNDALRDPPDDTGFAQIAEDSVAAAGEFLENVKNIVTGSDC